VCLVVVFVLRGGGQGASLPKLKITAEDESFAQLQCQSPLPTHRRLNMLLSLLCCCCCCSKVSLERRAPPVHQALLALPVLLADQALPALLASLARRAPLTHQA
jgi:hypothetical protein